MQPTKKESFAPCLECVFYITPKLTQIITLTFLLFVTQVTNELQINSSSQLSNVVNIRQIVLLVLAGVTYHGTEVKIHLFTKSGSCFLQLGPIMTWNQSLLGVHHEGSRTAQLSKHSMEST